MPYHIRHSEAIICSAEDSGEHDRTYWAFTREDGFIRARAKSVRTLRSKLRYALQPSSIVTIDYLRGKNGWKITSAISQRTFPNIITEGEKRTVLAQALRLLSRLVHGEEKNSELYDDLFHMMSELDTAVGGDKVAVIELVIAMRILYRLGYWGNIRAESTELLLSPFASLPYEDLRRLRAEIVPAINAALRETHL